MKTIANTFLKGLLFTLPLVITFGLIYWLFSSAEAVFKVPLMWVLPPGAYVTGMGVASAFLLIFGVGVVAQIYILGPAFAWFEKLLGRIPLIKTLYSSARDLLHFMAGNKNSDLQKVVAITIDRDIRLIGFVTNEQITLGEGTDLLAVYFPMSYQVGGYLTYVPKSRCEFLDMTSQQAMQQVLTAHIKRSS